MLGLLLHLADFARAADPLPPVSTALVAQYDGIRVALLADDLAGAGAAATAFSATTAADPTVAADAQAIAAAPDLVAARAGFSVLTKTFAERIAASSPVPKVVTYFCPMYSGYGWWFQPKSGIGNPYMGTAMPTCGEEKSLKAAVKAAAQ